MSLIDGIGAIAAEIKKHVPKGERRDARLKEATRIAKKLNRLPGLSRQGHILQELDWLVQNGGPHTKSLAKLVRFLYEQYDEKKRDRKEPPKKMRGPK